MARPGPASEGSSSCSLIASAQGSDSPRMAATCEENCVVNGEQPAVPSSGAAGPSAPAAAAAAACPGGLTFDQALTQYVGEFGRGQIANFVLASLVWIPNAVIILLLVFSVGSPIKDKAWECVDPADPACVAVLTSTDPAVGFCGLQRDQWRWLEPSKTLVAQFDLVCKGERWLGVGRDGSVMGAVTTVLLCCGGLGACTHVSAVLAKICTCVGVHMHQHVQLHGHVHVRGHAARATVHVACICVFCGQFGVCECMCICMCLLVRVNVHVYTHTRVRVRVCTCVDGHVGAWMHLRGVEGITSLNKGLLTPPPPSTRCMEVTDCQQLLFRGLSDRQWTVRPGAQQDQPAWTNGRAVGHPRHVPFSLCPSLLTVVPCRHPSIASACTCTRMHTPNLIKLHT